MLKTHKKVFYLRHLPDTFQVALANQKIQKLISILEGGVVWGGGEQEREVGKGGRNLRRHPNNSEM